MHSGATVLATAIIFCPQAGAGANPQPLDIEILGPGAIVLAMPLDLSVAATPRTPGGLSFQCFGVWVQRDGKWTLHREADPSLGDGVPGGVPGGGEVGHRYELRMTVHLEETAVYAKARLALASPGSYRIRVTYHPDCDRLGRASAISNEITVRVVPPAAQDRLVFEREVRDEPELLSPSLADLVDPDGERRATLVTKYPHSVYAPLWRLRAE